MFGAAADRAAGIPVVNEPYPDGEAGIQKSLAVMCTKIREGMTTAVMKSFAGNVLKQYGFPTSVRDRTAALLDFVRKNIAYAPDALGTEQIQSAAITLCVEGAPVCIPCGDCFPEGTLLLRRDGQLVPIEEIEVGDEIWGQDKWVEVEAKAFKGKLKVDAIELNNGSIVYLTPDHHVYVGKCKHNRLDCSTCRGADRDANGYDRIRVGDLAEGARMLQPERVAFGDSSFDTDRMYIEGLALSEGWVRENGREFSISGQDGSRKEALKHEVKAICDRLGIETRWHRKYITVKDPEWAARLQLLGSRARFKRASTLNLNEETAAALLRGLMSDSTADSGGKSRTYATTSYQMMVQVRVLQRMFGKRTSVRALTPEQHRGFGKHPLWRVGVNTNRATETMEKSLLVRSIERTVKKVPCWDIQTTDHHVYLPEHDVTVSQCDDLVTALGTLTAALGMECRVVRQIFGGDAQQHVLLEVKDERGAWLAADPTSKTMPVGKKAFAVRETTCSPWDGAVTGFGDQAQFVGIGSLPGAALPVLMLSGGGWHQIDHLPSPRRGVGSLSSEAWVEIAPGVQARVDTGDISVGFGDLGGACCASCANGGSCEGTQQMTLSRTGAGSIVGDLTAQLQLTPDPELAVKQFWALLQGRNWQAAILNADERARTGAWVAGSFPALQDLITLIMATGFNARGWRGDPRATDALLRTWVILLRRAGISVTQPTYAAVQDKPIAGLEVPELTVGGLLFILALTAGAAALLGVALYYGDKVVDNVLSKAECDRELMRLHAEWDRIVESHRQSGTPFSSDEQKVLDQLEAQQQFVANGCTKPKPDAGIPWSTIAVGAGIVGVTVLGVMYAPEIKRLFADAKRR